MAEEKGEEVWEEDEEVGAASTSQEHPFQATTLLSPASSFWILFGCPFRPRKRFLLPTDGQGQPRYSQGKEVG